jgi:DNA ligase-1
VVSNSEEVQIIEQNAIDSGYEGVMLRSPNSPYKCGRSTLKEEYLLKVKRFFDAEAEVVGFIEQMHNANEAEKDAFGRTKRSSKKAGMVPANTLGELRLKDLQTGLEFGCGTGLSQELRKQIWTNQDDYRGKIVTFKYQPSGQKSLPRFPVFKGFRHENDL